MEIISIKYKFKCENCNKIFIEKKQYIEGDSIIVECPYCGEDEEWIG